MRVVGVKDRFMILMEKIVLCFFLLPRSEATQRRWGGATPGAPPLKTTSTPHAGMVSPPSPPPAVPA